jgi:hypothetical protein
MMEAVRTSETSVDNHFTRQYNPEDSSAQVLDCLFVPVTSFFAVYMNITNIYKPFQRV